MRFPMQVATAALALVAAFALTHSDAWSASAPREKLVVTSSTGAHDFNVEIADDDRERERGLMFRRSMADDEGMLFDFKSEQPVSFWMRNTYITLDMLFIKADGTVESIAAHATPLSERSILSKGAVRYVLEINGGLSERLSIDSGDKVSGPAIDARR